ncbi:MAG: hypothetical protein KA375_07200 [Vitreoscilla sp.]|nr:hypothetical protein [Burkholderiales bacterium]MBP6337365.1 hypothetical protein [Vitreoscilla sp.]MBP6675464.1 hypothetical protein [Vitreoscilla sp.]
MEICYCYFSSKDGLYIRVLQGAHSRNRRIEAELRLEKMEPERALRTLVGFTCDHQPGNPDLSRAAKASSR